MASCTFVPILSNNTEKELYSIDYRYNYTTAGCADILFMGSIEYVCIGAASPLWARGQKQERPAQTEGHRVVQEVGQYAPEAGR